MTNNSLEVEPYLIPLKYRINQELTSLNKYPENARLPKERSIINKIFNLKFKSKRELYTKEKIGILYKKRLNEALKRENYNIEDFVREAWQILRNRVSDPFSSYMEIYFDYIMKKDIVADFGSQLADIIEEVLRDHRITDMEKKYILEKAKEYGMDEEEIEGLLDKYSSNKFETAFSKLIFEICKDGKITETEKYYLLEKATNCNVNIDRTRYIFINTIKIINKIKKAFENVEFYNWVLTLYLVQFIDANDVYIYQKIIKSLNSFVYEGIFKRSERQVIDVTRYCINKINRIIGFCVIDEEDNDFECVLNYLGIKIQNHQDFSKKLVKFDINILIDDVNGLLLNLKEHLDKCSFKDHLDSYLSLNNDVFKIGQRIYQVSLMESQSESLFNYRIRGLEVTVFVNRHHYFFNDSPYFKKLIVSIVHNLICNHSYENLVDEVKMLIRPPAGILINYPKDE